MREEYQYSAVSLPPALRGYQDNESFVGLITNRHGEPDLEKFKSLSDKSLFVIVQELVNNAEILGAVDDTENPDAFLSEVLARHKLVYDQHTQQYFSMMSALRDSYRDSDTDPLTGLFNKKAFGEFTLKKIAKFQMHAIAEQRNDPEVEAAYGASDADRFKPFNELFDYDVGDQAIKALANFLKGQLRDEDRVARLGGDEFGILLNNVNKEQAAAKFQSLRDNVKDLYITVAADRPISLTALERDKLGLNANTQYLLSDLSEEVLYEQIGMTVKFVGKEARLYVPASFGFEMITAQSNQQDLDVAANKDRKANKEYHPTYERA